MSKDMLIAVGAGATSGFASLAFLSGLPGAMLIVYLAPLPLLIVGINQGIKSVTISSASGFVTTILAGNILFGVLYTALHVFPSWIIVRQALLKYSMPFNQSDYWDPAGSSLCILSVFAAGILTLALVWSQGEIGGLQSLIQSYLEEVFSKLPMDENLRNGLVRTFVPLFPGYMGTMWVFLVVLNASIAMAVLKQTKCIKKPNIKLENLKLPDWISWFIVIAASVYLLSVHLFSQKELEFFGRNLTLMLAVPFFFLGLAVLHNLANHVTFPRLLLTAFYLALLLNVWVALMITLTGIIEQWFGLRRYFKDTG